MVITVFLKFKNCKYDKISELTLILFCLNFYLDFFMYYTEIKGWNDYPVYTLITGYLYTILYAFNMTRLFMFIFEVDNIRILLTINKFDNQ
jgi:hypothetical protein